MNNIVEFIRRHWLLTLLILFMILVPGFAEGVLRFILYAMLGVLLLGIVVRIAFGIWLERRRREMENGMGGGASFRTYTWGGRRNGDAGSSSSQEGEVKVQQVKRSPDKRVRGDVGDYVDYEEMPEEKQ